MRSVQVSVVYMLSNLGTEIEFLAEYESPLIERNQDVTLPILTVTLDSILQHRVKLIRHTTVLDRYLIVSLISSSPALVVTFYSPSLALTSS